MEVGQKGALSPEEAKTSDSEVLTVDRVGQEPWDSGGMAAWMTDLQKPKLIISSLIDIQNTNDGIAGLGLPAVLRSVQKKK